MELRRLRLRRRLKEMDELADGVVAVVRVPEREFAVHLVGVATSDAGLGQIAGLFQLGDDLADGSFGDADVGGDVPSRVPGSAAMHASTWAWLVMNRHAR